MFGETPDIRKNIFHRISLVYAGLVWTALGMCFYYFNYECDDTNPSDGPKPLPHQQEIDAGGAYWYMTNLKSSQDIEGKEMWIYRMKGFSLEKENVTQKVQETLSAKEEDVERESDNIYLRKKLDLPLTRDVLPDEELKAKVEEMGKDYELELDYIHQMSRRDLGTDTRTVEELEKEDTFEAKVKLKAKKLGMVIDDITSNLDTDSWEEEKDCRGQTGQEERNNSETKE